MDSSKDAADNKLKEYIDNFVEYHHDKAEFVKIVLLTGRDRTIVEFNELITPFNQNPKIKFR